MTTSIRNVGILAHVDAGKTTTTEYILFTSGQIAKLGRVDQGTAHTDSLDVERTRGISVKAAVTRFTWRDCTINLIDTPGHVDFSAEVERALSVLDGVVLVVSAVEGIQSHTETLWRSLQMMNIPTMIYVNKMDRQGIDVHALVTTLQSTLHPRILPLQQPVGAGDDFSGVIDWFAPDANPDVAQKQRWQDTVYVALAESDDSLFRAYVEGIQPTAEGLQAALIEQSHRAQVFPLLFGAALKGIGIPELLDAMTRYLPPAAQSYDDPLSGVVFKVDRDPAQGRITYVRLFSGQLKNRDSVRNITRSVEEKVNQIRTIDGHRLRDAGAVTAGDVGALFGLGSARVGDVLGSRGPLRDVATISQPLLTVQVLPDHTDDYTALAEAMQVLGDEDPALDVTWLPDVRELHIKVMGTIQLEVLQTMIQERFGLAVSFTSPSVIYQETPTQSGYGFVAYTMPKPCWAILRFLIEPGAPGSGVTFASQVRTEDLLQRYQNEVERRVPEALAQGLYGWQVTDVKVTLVEGQHHVWHTHPLDFVVATPMALMDGLTNTGVTLLEPILQFRVSAPADFGGRVMNDLAQRRAAYENPVIVADRFELEGTVPLATTMDYAVELGIQTGGRATFHTTFHAYRPCPSGTEAKRTRRGVDPRDTARYILWARQALSV